MGRGSGERARPLRTRPAGPPQLEAFLNWTVDEKVAPSRFAVILRAEHDGAEHKAVVEAPIAARFAHIAHVVRRTSAEPVRSYRQIAYTEPDCGCGAGSDCCERVLRDLAMERGLSSNEVLDPTLWKVSPGRGAEIFLERLDPWPDDESAADLGPDALNVLAYRGGEVQMLEFLAGGDPYETWSTAEGKCDCGFIWAGPHGCIHLQVRRWLERDHADLWARLVASEYARPAPADRGPDDIDPDEIPF